MTELTESERVLRRLVAPYLVLTVGLPCAGKTTWAREQGVPIVQPDAIRLAMHGMRFLSAAEPWVWAMAHTMVAALFRAGHELVILDATNTTVQRRQEWVSPTFETRYYVLDTPRDLCVSRASQRGDEELVPVIMRMAAQWEPLTSDERAFRLTPGMMHDLRRRIEQRGALREAAEHHGK